MFSRNRNRIVTQSVHRTAFEAMEARRLNALIGPDLVAVGMNLSSSDPVNAGTTDINFTIKNDGGLFGNAGAFWVTFYRCDESPYDEYISYSRIGEYWVPKLDSGKTFSGTHTISSPLAGDDNEGWILMEIDSTRAQGEWNENNNFLNAEGKDFVPYSVEGDLVRHPAPWVPTRAQPIGVNGIYNGFIGDEGVGSRDFDLFDVNVTAGRIYGVDLDRVSGSSLDSYVRVYDANWNLVAFNDNGRDENEPAGSDAFTSFTAGSTGTYHVVVSNTFNRSSDPRVLAGRTASSSVTATGGFTLCVFQTSQPIVNLEVLDGSATESASDGATIRVHRSGSPDAALVVNWSIGGTASYGNDYYLGTASAGGLQVTIPAGQQYVDVTLHAGDDGAWEGTESVTFQLTGGFGYSGGVSSAASINIFNAANDRPRVIASTDVFTDNLGQRVTFSFDDLVGASLSSGDFVLVNHTTQQTVSSSLYTVSWSDTTRTATVWFTGFSNGRLPDGEYTITAKAADITNGGGLGMESNRSHSFFALAGDLNRDRSVDFNDLLLLAKNYGKTGCTLTSGNADGSADGSVNFNDLLVLAKGYGKSLPNPLANLFAATTPISSPSDTATLARRR